MRFAGDRLTVEIEVDAGACAHITTQSATKIHSMDNNFAAQTQHIRVGKQAYLEFMPDQVIPHRHLAIYQRYPLLNATAPPPCFIRKS